MYQRKSLTSYIKISIFAVIISITASITYAQDTMEMRKPRMVAPAASANDLNARLDRLEQNITAMQKQLYSGVNRPAERVAPSSGTSNVQLEEIYQQIRTLRGDVEQLQFENTKTNEKITKLASDIEFRFNDMASNPNNDNKDIKKLSSVDEQLNQAQMQEGSDQAALSQKGDEGKPNESSDKGDKLSKLAPNATPEEQYQEAYSLLKERNFDASEKLFLVFVDKNKTHQLVGNSYFWLGEISLQKNDYNNAAVRYLKGYQSNQKSTRAPDNLLKLAESLAALKKRKEACMTLNKLHKEFPNASSTIHKKAEERSRELKCDAT